MEGTAVSKNQTASIVTIAFAMKLDCRTVQLSILIQMNGSNCIQTLSTAPSLITIRTFFSDGFCDSESDFLTTGNVCTMEGTAALKMQTANIVTVAFATRLEWHTVLLLMQILTSMIGSKSMQTSSTGPALPTRTTFLMASVTLTLTTKTACLMEGTAVTTVLTKIILEDLIPMAPVNYKSS